MSQQRRIMAPMPTTTATNRVVDQPTVEVAAPVQTTRHYVVLKDSPTTSMSVESSQPTRMVVHTPYLFSSGTVAQAFVQTMQTLGRAVMNSGAAEVIRSSFSPSDHVQRRNGSDRSTPLSVLVIREHCPTDDDGRLYSTVRVFEDGRDASLFLDNYREFQRRHVSATLSPVIHLYVSNQIPTCAHCRSDWELCEVVVDGFFPDMDSTDAMQEEESCDPEAVEQEQAVNILPQRRHYSLPHSSMPNCKRISIRPRVH